MKVDCATVGSNDFERAKAFYDALLLPFGFEVAFEHPSGGRVDGQGGWTAFAVVGAFDREPASVGDGTMLSFHCTSQEEATAIHARALELGATDEGPPSVRGGPFFMSYFRDLAGNKLCAFHQAERY